MNEHPADETTPHALPAGLSAIDNFLNRNADTFAAATQVLSRNAGLSAIDNFLNRNADTFAAATQVLSRNAGLSAIDNFLNRNADTFAAATQVLSRNADTIVLPEYQDVARSLLKTLGAEVEDPVPFTPSTDDSAYQALASVDPAIVSAIDDAAESVKTSFWSRRVVRNSLAWLVVTLIVTAWVAGAFLPAPLGGLLAGLYGTAQAAVQVKKHLAAPPDSRPIDEA